MVWEQILNMKTSPSIANKGDHSTPTLQNPRHERFAQTLATGKTADAAYGRKPRGRTGPSSHRDAIMAKNLTGNAVAYIRVSTGKQAKSGLGLEAQTEAIRAFAATEGYKIAGSFEERESGKGGRHSATVLRLTSAQPRMPTHHRLALAIGKGTTIKRFLFAFALVVWSVAPVFSATYSINIAPVPNATYSTYHMATNGNDSNPGTEALPWLTANHTVNCGDVVIVAPGSYTDVANFGPNMGQVKACPSSASTPVYQAILLCGGTYNRVETIFCWCFRLVCFKWRRWRFELGSHWLLHNWRFYSKRKLSGIGKQLASVSQSGITNCRELHRPY
jgi:hypothetical protein